MLFSSYLTTKPLNSLAAMSGLQTRSSFEDQVRGILHQFPRLKVGTKPEIIFTQTKENKPIAVEIGKYSLLAQTAWLYGVKDDFDPDIALELGLVKEKSQKYFFKYVEVPDGANLREIRVSQQRGWTDIIILYRYPSYLLTYLTSPDGVLKKIVRTDFENGQKKKPYTLEITGTRRDDFQKELDWFQSRPDAWWKTPKSI